MKQASQYAFAKEFYAQYGVDTEAALNKLQTIPVSIHAWQGDDVAGFENTGHALTGGCQVTGNHPGKARNADELRADLDEAMKFIPGTLRVCLQGHQVDKMLPGVDRDAFTMENFSSWLDWAKDKKIGMDIAPAYYSHPKLDHGLSLSHPDAGIRKFWIDHGRAIRRIGEGFGKVLGTPSVCNVWAPDGFKEVPADLSAPRARLAEALDETFAEKIDEKYELDAVEPKLFGIGVESYTVGSADFYLTYAAKHNKLICFDSGHFHPTETIGEKLSAVCCQQGRILLHVSRGVRWDSDHVTLLNDELLSIGKETVNLWNGRNIYICLDYFDGSINRLSAWVTGAQAFSKAMLIGLLTPKKCLTDLENKWDFSGRLALAEAAKSFPWGIVWAEYLRRNSIDEDASYMKELADYEKRVLFKR